MIKTNLSQMTQTSFIQMINADQAKATQYGHRIEWVKPGRDHILRGPFGSCLLSYSFDMYDDEHYLINVMTKYIHNGQGIKSLTLPWDTYLDLSGSTGLMLLIRAIKWGAGCVPLSVAFDVCSIRPNQKPCRK